MEQRASILSAASPRQSTFASFLLHRTWRFASAFCVVWLTASAVMPNWNDKLPREVLTIAFGTGLLLAVIYWLIERPRSSNREQ